MMASNFARMNNQRFNNEVNEKDKEKDNKEINKSNNENDNKNDNNLKDNSTKNKPQVKTTRFVENLLHSKKEEKVLVGFRLDKSVSDAIDSIVDQHKLKKGEFVNDILKKALGL